MSVSRRSLSATKEEDRGRKTVRPDFRVRQMPVPYRPDSESGSSAYSGSHSDDDIGYGVSTRLDSQKGCESSDQGMTFNVQLVTKSGTILRDVNWPGEFNLENALSQARRDLGQLPARKSMFQLTSIVNTNARRPDMKEMRRFNSEDSPRIFSGIVCQPGVNPVQESTLLSIRSVSFMDALRSVVTYHPGFDLDPEGLQLHEPFALIAHHLDKLKEKKSKLDEFLASETSIQTAGRRSAASEAAHGLDIVLKFMAHTVEQRMAKERELQESHPPLCTFRMLWMHYVPGKTLYVRADGQMSAVVLGSVFHMGHGCFSGSFDQLGPCRLDTWFLDYNGDTGSVSRRWRSFDVCPFEGTREILSLDAIPREIWDKTDGSDLGRKLEAQGEKWFSLLHGQHMDYEGRLYDKRGVAHFQGRVYVDPASWHKSSPSDAIVVTSRNPFAPRRPNAPRRSRYAERSRYVEGSRYTAYVEEADIEDMPDPEVPSRMSIEGDKQWSNFGDITMAEISKMTNSCDPETLRLRYLLVTKRIKAFIFKTREWNTLDVEFCQKPKANRTPFDRLVMPEARKSMIRSLVYKYTDRKSRAWSADYIQNKGDGLIFLLHGSPGVGKTFTAECIAELTGQPLLALTCADIGTDEVEMEAKLGEWLRLGHKWGAVMLIDEADVLMEKRQHADLKRNSLVSVFLREIEYYKGILFLTTNRVGQFDDAFISRIHVVIHYENLNKAERDRIWNQFFDKLEDEKGQEIKIQRSARRYVLENPEITKVPWNGREIRNAFQTAVALAEYRFLATPDREKGENEMAELREEDLKQVCEMTKAFKKYLTEVHDDYDEFERAALSKLRRGSTGGAC